MTEQTVSTATPPNSMSGPDPQRERAPGSVAPSESGDYLARMEARRERQAVHRDDLTLLIFALSAIALLTAIVAVGFSMRAIDESKRNVHSASTAGSSVATGATSPAKSMVHLSEFMIEPKQISVAEGGALQVMNAGTMTHNLAVKNTKLATKMLGPGDAEELSLAGLPAGTYTVFCQVPGHEQAGMVASLNVGAAASDGSSAASPSAAAKSAPAAGAATVDFNASPSPDWHSFDPTLKPATDRRFTT
jgi:plastocyanin